MKQAAVGSGPFLDRNWYVQKHRGRLFFRRQEMFQYSESRTRLSMPLSYVMQEILEENLYKKKGSWTVPGAHFCAYRGAQREGDL